MSYSVNTIIINGESKAFTIIHNLSLPCPICGVPSCGKEYYLWTEVNEEKLAFVFDGGMFDCMIGDIFSENFDKVWYTSLPEFIKQWNEGKGWNDFELDLETVIDQSDFENAMNLIRGSELTGWIKGCFESYYQSIMQIMDIAKTHHAELYILKT